MMGLQRQARAAAPLRQYDRVLEVADAMIAREPQVFAGHWFRGIALEGQGLVPEALQAFEAALERLPAQTRRHAGAFSYVDSPVFERVRQLRERLTQTPR